MQVQKEYKEGLWNQIQQCNAISPTKEGTEFLKQASKYIDRHATLTKKQQMILGTYIRFTKTPEELVALADVMPLIEG